MLDLQPFQVKAFLTSPRMNPLILASSSRYRAELLRRLQLPFRQASPEVDETPRPRETARGLATRLALAKAEAVVQRFPGVWVIGSDQAVACGSRLLGKPGNRMAACEQLGALSGRAATFVTGVSLVKAGEARRHRAVDVTIVRVRRLRPDDIERYVDAEPAYDCAGGFKMEGLGIALFDRIESADPTGLIGLPLIATARLLRRAGYVLP
jgi:septum formation protein